MNKQEVQQRVLKNGKPLSLDQFTWDEKTFTFSSNIHGLVLDFTNLSGGTFKTGSGCTFKTDSDCTFKTGSDCTFTTGWRCTFTTYSYCTFTTGSDCTFKTGSDCTFKTGWDCTFKTGPYCTFKTDSDCTFTTYSDCTFTTGKDSVIVRRYLFEIIQPEPDIALQLAPQDIPGYVSNGIYSVTGKPSIMVDGVLSEVVKKKGNVYHVINYGESEVSYLVTDGTNWSHGKTLKEAKDSLKYKLSNRDTTFCEGWKLDDKIDTVDLIKAYRAITGACESQTKAFCESQKLPKQITPAEAIKLTQGQYNAQVFAEFFGSKKSTREVTL